MPVTPSGRRPNFVVVFAGDLGWGDLGSYGAPVIWTPHLNRMTAQDQRWTNFYVTASVYSLGLAGLLAGRLGVRSKPYRVGRGSCSLTSRAESRKRRPRSRSATPRRRAHRDERFFVYLPHCMPHVPLFRAPEFEGHSGARLYGDVIEEIDWSVGRILDTLEEEGIGGNTLVFFSSDNGPWTAFRTQGGLAGPLREGKG